MHRVLYNSLSLASDSLYCQASFHHILYYILRSVSQLPNIFCACLTNYQADALCSQLSGLVYIQHQICVLCSETSTKPAMSA